MKRTSLRPRRGVVLLVVLGLLALFGLVMVTFMMTSEQHQMGSEARSVSERYGDPPRIHLRRALEQVLSGTTNPGSGLQVDSLLEDMYGPPSISSDHLNNRVIGVDQALRNQGLLQFSVTGPLAPPGTGYLTSFANEPGYYSGQVLTFISGQARGKSTRILKYRVPDRFGQQAFFVCHPFDGMQHINPGDRFIINGRAFSGVGVGMDPDSYTSNGLLNWSYDNQAGAALGLMPVPDVLQGLPVALLPNPSTQLYRNYLTYVETARIANGLAPAYHPNEDYDAPDFNNMLLSFTVYPPGMQPITHEPSLHRTQLMLYWANQLPGVTVPNVPQAQVNAVNMAFQYRGPNAPPDPSVAPPELKRAITLRPIAEFHPEFALVNPEYEREPFGYIDAGGVHRYHWDVDNSGDGVTDSIWVDLGLPVATDEQGRRYKPLFAILVRDQDGKLNLNVHGVLNDQEGGQGSGQLVSHPVQPGGAIPMAGISNSPQMFNQPGLKHAGEGLSPASVSLHAVLDHPIQQNQGQMIGPMVIKRGRMTGTGPVAGVYGEPELLQQGGFPRPGITGFDSNYPPTATQQVAGQIGPWAVPVGNAGSAVLFGRPVDFNENGGYFVDAAGRPRFLPNFHGAATEAMNDPGELNVFKRFYYELAGQLTAADMPFTPRDLYWLRNPFARDVAVGSFQGDPFGFREPVNAAEATGSRLPWLLRNQVQWTAELRESLTTHSVDVPVPPFKPTPEMLHGIGLREQENNQQFPKSGLSFVDLVRAKMKAVNPAMTENQINNLLYQTETEPARFAIALPEFHPDNPGGLPGAELIAPELLAGLKINLNRPLGDGFDYTGDGILNPITSLLDPNANPQAGQLWGGLALMDPYPDGQAPGQGDLQSLIRDARSKQRLAKQLYFTMMVLKDHNYLDPTIDPTAQYNDTVHRELTSRRIAQWAINVVDYLDRDSIMTPFEYDANPFDGWHVDGNIETAEEHPDRRVVWGMEAPVAVLTETLAFHDLAVKDKEDPQQDTVPDDPEDPGEPGQDYDDDTDQNRPPQGSAFVEILCVADPHNPVRPMELFNENGQLDLGRMAGPPGSPGEYPVWRVAVSESHLELERRDPGPMRRTQLRYGQNGMPLLTPDQDDQGQEMSLFAENPDFAIPQPVPYTQGPNGQQQMPNPNSQPPGWKTGTLLPQEYQAGGPNNFAKRIERIVWMGPTPPSEQVMDRGRIYYKGTGNPTLLFPGQHAVIGPHRGDTIEGNNGLVTRIGRSEVEPSVQEIDLRDGTVRVSNPGVEMQDSEPYNEVGDRFFPPVSVPARWLLDYTPQAEGLDLGRIPFSISEPLPILAAGGDSYEPTSYYNIAVTSDQFMDATHIAPNVLNVQTSRDLYPSGQGDRPLDFNIEFPLVRDGIIPDADNGDSFAPVPGVYENYKTVYLQRLADPTRDWDPITNPYITVDFLPIDLTVFTGEDTRMHKEGSLVGDSMTNAEGIQRFASRERGIGGTQQNNEHPDINFLRHASVNPLDTQPVQTANPPQHIGRVLRHTLGYLNSTYHSADTGGHQTDPPAPYYLANNPYNDPTLVGQPDSGRMQPWMEWPNSPLRSPLELMQVPASSPQRLNFEFTTFRAGSGDTQPHRFYNRTGRTAGAQASGLDRPFGHLLNFTHSNNASLSGTPGQPAGQNDGHDAAASNYFRIFDYVGIPSRFSGAQEMLNPAIFQGPANPALSGLYPPFNIVDTYREPGRININTIADTTPRTWLGMTNHFGDRDGDGMEDTAFARTNAAYRPLRAPAYSPTWNEIQQSRMGYLGYLPNVGRSQHLPMLFGQPFRGYSTGFPVPVAELRRNNDSNGQPGTANYLFADSGLMRRMRNPQGTGDSSQLLEEPLFRFLSNSDPRQNAQQERNSGTLATGVVLGEFNDSFRHSSFRFDLLKRMSNVATTRSNVYCVWITVGYFEVAPAPPYTDDLGQQYPAGVPSPRYPDGVMLGQELGAEEGEVRRHKSFYVIDRSIPVGFERGRPHNADQAVIFEQYFEAN